MRTGDLRATLESPPKLFPPQLQATCTMERAARLFNNKRLSREIMTDEDVARAAWPTAVGKAIAAHTSRVKLVRNTLVVEVEDAIWQKQLHTLSRQILDRLCRFMGSTVVSDLEFRIGVPRRAPQREESRTGELFTGLTPTHQDGAEGIQDPVLKKVYRLSRKKATA
jgi:predicted nucleic acid-binding Zn ribbon protein